MKYPALTAALVVVVCLNIIFVALANIGVPSVGTFTVWHDTTTGELIGGGDFLFFAWLPILDVVVGIGVFFGMRRLLAFNGWMR